MDAENEALRLRAEIERLTRALGEARATIRRQKEIAELHQFLVEEQEIIAYAVWEEEVRKFQILELFAEREVNRV